MPKFTSFFVLFIKTKTVCYHNSISTTPKALELRYKAEFPEKALYTPIYHSNGFSHPLWPILSSRRPSTIILGQWGLVPGWAKDPIKAKELQKRTLNCIHEESAGKPSFRTPVKNKQFVVIPSTGFFEWQHQGKDKIPYFITSLAKEENILSMAGIFDTWKDSHGDEHLTFSILTTQAKALMAEIHNSKERMPAILLPGTEQAWLSGNIPMNELNQFLLPEDQLQATRISKTITSAENTNIPEVQKTLL